MVGQSSGLWLERDEAGAILSPYHSDLRGCVSVGWEKWLNQVKPLYPRPTLRFRANAIWDGMIDEARVRFNDVPGVNIIDDHRSTFFLTFDGRLLVRFKKLDDRLRTRNYPTQQALTINGQMDLPEVPDGSLVTIGYRTDELGMSLKDVLVVMSRSNRVRWAYDLDKEIAAAAVPNVVPITPRTPSLAEAPPVDINRFRSRKQEDPKTEDHER
jgi:hypothetical protein